MKDNKEVNKKNEESTSKVEKNINSNDNGNKFNKKIDGTKNTIKQKIKRVCEDKNKTIIIIIVAIFILVMLSLLSSNKDSENKNSDFDYKVKVHVDFTENILFSRYNVVLSLGNKEKTLYHGESDDFIFNLDGGEYTLKFENSDDSSIKYEEKIEVSGNMELGYKISCHYDKIEVEKIYNYSDVPIAENEIKIDFDKTHFNSKNYKDVIEELKSLGFSNITEKPLYDIVIGWTSEGEIKTVTINGNDTYTKGNTFNKDVEIVVSYHLNEQDDPSRIKAPYDTDSAKGINYKEVEAAFKEAGFTNIKISKTTTSNYDNNETVSSIYVGVLSDDVKKSLTYDPNEEIKITYYEYVKKETKPRPGEVSLSVGGARNAFEKYGEAIYRYGFKCHWWVGLLDEKENDDGSIYLKVEVTITNQYNAKYKAVAEALVKGTDVNPIVTNFSVK